MFTKPILNKVFWISLAAIIPLLIKGIIDFFKFRSSRVQYDENELSISPQQAMIIADIQETAMDAFLDIDGTDVPALFDSLDGLNSSDLKLVFNSFGNRPYLFQGKSGSWLGSIIPSTNLFSWYIEELSGQHLQDMRNLWLTRANLRF